jgi:hypothetical protein
VNRLRFCTLSTVDAEDQAEDQMEKPQFDGKAIEGLRDLVEHSHQQERSRQPSSDAAEGHGRANPSEEARRVS